MPRDRPEDQDASETITSTIHHGRPMHGEHGSSDATKRGRKRKPCILDDGRPRCCSGRKRLKKSKSVENLRKSKRASVVAKRNPGNAPISQSDTSRTRTRNDSPTKRPKTSTPSNPPPAKLSFPPPELSPAIKSEITSTSTQSTHKTRKLEPPKITVHVDATRYSYAALLDLYSSEEAKRTLRQRQLNDRLVYPGNVSDVENWSPNRDAASRVQFEQYRTIQDRADVHSAAMAALTPAPNNRKEPSLSNVALQHLRNMR